MGNPEASSYMNLIYTLLRKGEKFTNQRSLSIPTWVACLIICSLQTTGCHPTFTLSIQPLGCYHNITVLNIVYTSSMRPKWATDSCINVPLKMFKASIFCLCIHHGTYYKGYMLYLWLSHMSMNKSVAFWYCSQAGFTDTRSLFCPLLCINRIQASPILILLELKNPFTLDSRNCQYRMGLEWLSE